MSSAKIFTVLDLKDGFYHIKLDKSSSELCTFSTSPRFYRRLPFGISCTPEEFQERKENNVKNNDNVIVYFDDLLIYVRTEEEHDKILQLVINRAREKNIKFNKNKVQFKSNEVKYFGLNFSDQGISPAKEYVDSILKLGSPKSVKDLQKFLGMINYLGKFVPNLSDLLSPLSEFLIILKKS